MAYALHLRLVPFSTLFLLFLRLGHLTRWIFRVDGESFRNRLHRKLTKKWKLHGAIPTQGECQLVSLVRIVRVTLIGQV